jgi:hypothetical protein
MYVGIWSDACYQEPFSLKPNLWDDFLLEIVSDILNFERAGINLRMVTHFGWPLHQ